MSGKKVITPFGPRPAEKVYPIPKGGRIVHHGNNIHLVDGAGNVIHTKPHDHTPVRRPQPAGGTSDVSQRVTPADGTWVAWAYWQNKTAFPIGSFTTSWSVPPYPTQDDGQTLFLFESGEPATLDAALLPALQYGPSAAGDGPDWSVATWYFVGSYVYYTRPITVSVGDALNGAITLTDFRTPDSTTYYDYSASFKNISDTTLVVRDNTVQLNWAFLTLESYNVKRDTPQDYPPGLTVFYPTNISLSPMVKWTPMSYNDITTTINVDGPTNSEITIQYPYNSSA